MALNIPKTTKQWTVEGFEGPSSLKFSEGPVPTLKDNEVLVQSKSTLDLFLQLCIEMTIFSI
jgi:hypothetical protein